MQTWKCQTRLYLAKCVPVTEHWLLWISYFSPFYHILNNPVLVTGKPKVKSGVVKAQIVCLSVLGLKGLIPCHGIYVRVRGYCVHLTLCHMTFHFAVFSLPCPAEHRGLPLVSRSLCWPIRGWAAPPDWQAVYATAATSREVGWQAMGKNGKQKQNFAYGREWW